MIYLNIAGFNLKICFHKLENLPLKNHLINELNYYYSGFFTHKPLKIDFTIHFIDNRLIEGMTIPYRNKLYINLYDITAENEIVTFYTIGIYQFQLLLTRIILRLFQKNDGFYLHASAVAINDHAIVFTGKPGSGKSTAANLLCQKYHKIADDGIFIRKIKGKYFCYSTPILDADLIGLKKNQKYYLDSVFFLRKAYIFKIIPIQDKEYIIQRILKQLITERELMKDHSRSVTQFANSFNNFNFLYFAKNQKKLVELIKKM